jgi:membrane-associated phospholipid phosphatase
LLKSAKKSNSLIFGFSNNIKFLESIITMKIKQSLLKLLLALISIMLLNIGNLDASDKIHKTGDVLQFILPGIAVGLTIYNKDGKGAFQLTESMALTIGVTYGLKFTVNEKRPNGGNYSFPSGHTSVSFSAAEFMRKRYGWEYGVPAYLLASFVGYSRVETNQHYTKDVLAGAGIGILSSFIFTKPYKGWEVSMEGDTKNIGFQFTKHF